MRFILTVQDVMLLSIKPFWTRALLPALLLFSFLSAGCEVVAYLDDDDYCYGEPEVRHAIPRVTLVVNAEQYVRDLYARPRVFFHTDDEHMYFDAYSRNERIAEAFVDEDGYLVVIPNRVGVTRVIVEAEDACGAYVSTSFRVEVIPPGAASKTESANPFVKPKGARK